MPNTLEISAENLHLWRGERHVLQGVSFRQGAGQLLRIAGANGSGKTSLLRVLAGLTLMEEGHLKWLFDGQELSKEERRGALAFLGHRDGLDDSLSTRENLVFGLQLAGVIPESDEINATLSKLNLDEQLNLPGKALSAGQRRRASLARVFLSKAPLWLLDEPYTHLDTAGIATLNRALLVHLEAGGLVILSTHDETLLPRPADLEVVL